MRVLIVTHHYPPEVGAPQTRLSGTASFLRSRGHDVCVVTAMPSYPTGVVPPEYRGRVLCQENRDGIRVVRTPTFARPGQSMRLRLLNQLSFAASGLLAAPLVGRRHVILAESPPLFVGATAAILGALKRAPVVLHVSDLWPRVPIELGALRHPGLIALGERFERTVYAACRRIIVVTHGWVPHLLESGVSRDRVRVITNGVDTAFFAPAEARARRASVRRELGVDGQILAVCVGTLSTVYDYELMLDAAERLKGSRHVRFLIAGGGSREAEVRRQLAERSLDDFVLLGPCPIERVRDLLGAADLSMVALRPLPVTTGQLPVRLLEAMAMELPVVCAGAGESAALVRRARSGIVVEPGDRAAFAARLAELAGDPERRRSMGANGRRAIEAAYSREAVAAQIEETLREAAGR